MGEENGTIQAVAVKFHHFQAVARCAGAEADRFSIPGVHVQVTQDRVVFEATDSSKAGVLAIPLQAAQTALDDGPSWESKRLMLPPAGFEAVIPLPKWTAIKPHTRTTLPCSSTLCLSFPEAGADRTPKVRMKCGLDGDGPVFTLDLLDGCFPKFSCVTGVSHLFHCATKQAASFFAKEMDTIAGAFELFHGPGSGRRSRIGRHMTIIPTMAQQAWGFYAEDSEDIPALFYAVLMSLRQNEEVQDVYSASLRPLLYSIAGDLRDPKIAAEEDALNADSLAYAAMAEHGRRIYEAAQERAAQDLIDSQLV